MFLNTMTLKELLKEFIEKFLLVGVSAGITAGMPVLAQYDGKWGLPIAVLAAVLVTINKYLKDEAKVYEKGLKAFRK